MLEVPVFLADSRPTVFNFFVERSCLYPFWRSGSEQIRSTVVFGQVFSRRDQFTRSNYPTSFSQSIHIKIRGLWPARCSPVMFLGLALPILQLVR